MLDMKSLSSLIYSSFIQLFCKSQNDFTLYQLCTNIQYPYKIQFMDNLKHKYKKEGAQMSDEEKKQTAEVIQ